MWELNQQNICIVSLRIFRAYSNIQVERLLISIASFFTTGLHEFSLFKIQKRHYNLGLHNCIVEIY